LKIGRLTGPFLFLFSYYALHRFPSLVPFQARVAVDALDDFLLSVLHIFYYPVRVSQQRPAYTNEVGFSLGQYLLTKFRGIYFP